MNYMNHTKEYRQKRTDMIELTKTYLGSKRAFFWGFRTFKFWKKHISYITGSDTKLSRSIFNALVLDDILVKEVRYIRIKGKSVRSILYNYNPNDYDEYILEKQDRVISFYDGTNRYYKLRKHEKIEMFKNIFTPNKTLRNVFGK